MESLPGYDRWLTTPPDDPDWVCPKCGRSGEDIPDLEVAGMEHLALMASPTTVEDDGARRRSTIRERRENAREVVIYHCECGWIGTDDALVTADEYHRE